MLEKINPNSVFEKFQRIIEKTKIPENKQGNVKWIALNFDLLEPEHPQRDEVFQLLAKLLFLDSIERKNSKRRII